MNRVEAIRKAEKEYHDHCYDQFKLFESGTWMYKPVQTVLDYLKYFDDRAYLSALDLGSGAGRNSIPIAESLRNRDGQVICVDLLVSAISKLKEYSVEFQVDKYIKPVQSEIETYKIPEDDFDFIIAVSAIEHVSSTKELKSVLNGMVKGTKRNGINVIIVSTNIRERDTVTNEELEPMYEVNMSTEKMMDLFIQNYDRWNILNNTVKALKFDIERAGRKIELTSDCLTFVTQNNRYTTEELVNGETYE